jgi:tetratricopeptide (TPR) repeat protein
MPDEARRARHRQALAHYNRGCELHGLQQFQAAIACYAQALALAPDLAAAHSNRGAALSALNRCDEALASLNRAIASASQRKHACNSVGSRSPGQST